MKIVNNTNLSYRDIGYIMDHIMEINYCNTVNYEKIEDTVVMLGGLKIKVQIRYLKRYTEWRFDCEEN